MIRIRNRKAGFQSRRTKKRTGFAVLFGLSVLLLLFGVAFSASASQSTGTEFPHFTLDGTGFATESNALIYARFGGTAFTPETDFKALGVDLQLCTTASTTALTYLDVYQVGTGGQYASDVFIDTWAGNVSPCSMTGGDPVETRFDTLWNFDGEAYLFQAGTEYMLVFTESQYENYPEAWIDFKLGTTNAPARNISVCTTPAFCAGFYLIENSYSMYLTFGNTGVPPVADLPCVINELPYIDVQQCIVNALVFTFVPNQATVDQFGDLTLASSTPFSYLYEMQGIAQAMTNVSATTTGISAPIMGENFTFLSSSMIASIPFVNVIKLLITAMLWLTGVYTVYRTVLRTFEHTQV